MKRQAAVKDALISHVYREPRYRGKKVLIVGETIVATHWGSSSVKQLKALLRQYPNETPTIVYVPKAETLILVL